MINIKLTSAKKFDLPSAEEKKRSYDMLSKLNEHDEKLKAIYAKKGLKKPEILA
jgi:hypothetical protein